MRTPSGTVFLIVSRGGNYVIRAMRDANGKLTIGAANVIRFQTGNIPNGVVISYDGRRAYVNNEVNVSVTVYRSGEQHCPDPRHPLRRASRARHL